VRKDCCAFPFESIIDSEELDETIAGTYDEICLANFTPLYPGTQFQIGARDRATAERVIAAHELALELKPPEFSRRVRAGMDDDRGVCIVQAASRDECLGLGELEEQVVRRFSVTSRKLAS
jgi:hypothetical protein